MTYKKKENFNYQLSYVGKRIREEREKRDLTQGELAEVTGVSISHLSNIERGTSKEIGFSKVCSIVKHLQTTLNDITTDDIPKDGLTLAVSEFSDEEKHLEKKNMLINLIESLDDDEMVFLTEVIHSYKKAIQKKILRKNLSDPFETYYPDVSK